MYKLTRTCVIQCDGPERLLTTDDRMLVDGLIYFVAMTAINVVNMVVFLDTSNPVRKGS